MRGRDGEAVGEAEPREIGQRRSRIQAVGLVDHQQHRARGLAQPLQDVIVQGRGALAPVDHEQDQVGLRRGRTRLACGGPGQPFLFACDAAGVDHHERTAFVQAADAVVAVAGHARLVVHQRIASARQRVEQRRLADIGAAHEGDRGEHVGPFRTDRRGWPGAYAGRLMPHSVTRRRHGCSGALAGLGPDGRCKNVREPARHRREAPSGKAPGSLARPAPGSSQSMRQAVRSPLTFWTTRMPSATTGAPLIAARPARSRAASSPLSRRSQCR